jgi:hypothetical protein
MRHGLGFWLVAAALAAPLPALAEEPAPVAPPPSAAPARRVSGFAVLALGGSGDSAWALAQAVYRSSLRPPAIDEAHARVLAGEPATAGSARDLLDLAETRDAIVGTDAPSRRLLQSIVATYGLEGLVTLRIEEGAPVARVMFAGAEDLDAASYRADPDGGWASLVRSLERSRAAHVPAAARARPAVPAPVEARRERERAPFYASGWFWGAIGAAAFAGGAIYFLTRDDSAGSIHVAMKVPR